MDRRKFIKDSALAAVAGASLTVPGISAAAKNEKKADKDIYPSRRGSGVAKDFKYNPDGKFKVLQLTDTHAVYGDPRTERARKNVEKMLDIEKPDLVIHTGDVIYGKPAAESAIHILTPIADRKIPFAVALGNHDSQFGLDRVEIYDLIRTIPYNINTPADKGIAKASNDVITLSGENGVDRVLYLFDSGDQIGIDGVGGYDVVRHNQIEWYQAHSKEFTAANGGKPIPSLAFFHIPPAEFDYALKMPVNGWNFIGHMGEHIGCSKLNSGLFMSMKECGDIQAIVCGHEHNNDFVMQYYGVLLIYGRFSGCDTVYNDLKPNGARVFEFTKGQRGFRSWVRLNSGEIEQDSLLDPPTGPNLTGHKESKK